MPRGRPKKSKETELAEIIKESSDIDSEEVELVPVEQVEIMSLSQLNEEKKKLAARKAKVQLENDKNRIEQSKIVIQRMSMILEKMLGYYDESGNIIDVSPMDMKLLTEAYKNMITSYNMVTRIDSVDSGGKAGRVSLKIEFDM